MNSRDARVDKDADLTEVANSLRWHAASGPKTAAVEIALATAISTTEQWFRTNGKSLRGLSLAGVFSSLVVVNLQLMQYMGRITESVRRLAELDVDIWARRQGLPD